MDITRTAGAGVEPAEGAGAPESEKQEPYTPLGGVSEADRSAGTTERLVEVAMAPRPILADPGDRKVEVTEADKAAFLDAVVNGTRFESTVDLFGGKVRAVLRSRSLPETEAILAHMQRKGLSGAFTTSASVQDESLLALLVAQVKFINGVEYAEMKAPLMYREDLDGVHDPAWIESMDIWRSKPVPLVSALGDALVDFEAKYWTMTRAAGDENFWKPDGSTGK